MKAPRFIEASSDQAARAGEISAEAWQLVIPESMYEQLQAHLFCGDGAEHAAVIAAGVLSTERGTRLLARNLVLAEDGRDFVPAKNAHRRLTPGFVNEHIRFCRDQGMAYLAIHNHGPGDRVGFSSVDLRSHERGYPALLDIARGQPVGALVLASEAVAGDVWTPDGLRHPVGETVIPGRNRRLLAPTPAAEAPTLSAIDDRQIRIYGDAGQALLRRLKVGVIGAGGVGLPTVGQLSRLGVGHVVVVDPDRVDLTNLPRLPESNRWDALSWLTENGRPAWLQRLGRRWATPKVRLARRVARRARRDIVVDALHADVADPTSVEQLLDCDYLVLAADSDTARAVFNALVFGFSIPGVQVGSKVSVDRYGTVGDISSVVRQVGPDKGCLWCNEVISPARLASEQLPEAVREAQRYLPGADAPAPSVITLNALGVAAACHHFMLWATGLLRPTVDWEDFRRTETRQQLTRTEIPRQDFDCPECGSGAGSLRASAHRSRMPVRLRS